MQLDLVDAAADRGTHESHNAAGVGYENDRCHFCGAPEAGYARAEDRSARGPFFDACYRCARRPYPQPAEFRRARGGRT